MTDTKTSDDIKALSARHKVVAMNIKGKVAVYKSSDDGLPMQQQSVKIYTVYSLQI